MPGASVHLAWPDHQLWREVGGGAEDVRHENCRRGIIDLAINSFGDGLRICCHFCLWVVDIFPDMGLRRLLVEFIATRMRLDKDRSASVSPALLAQAHEARRICAFPARRSPNDITQRLGGYDVIVRVRKTHVWTGRSSRIIVRQTGPQRGPTTRATNASCAHPYLRSRAASQGSRRI